MIAKLETVKSTNPHYVTNCVKVGDKEELPKFDVKEDKKSQMITNPSHHDHLTFNRPGKYVTRRVQTCDLMGKVKEICD